MAELQQIEHFLLDRLATERLFLCEPKLVNGKNALHPLKIRSSFIGEQDPKCEQLLLGYPQQTSKD